MALGCEQGRDSPSRGYSCEQKAIEAAGGRPVSALLTYYPTAALFATIAGCPQSQLTVIFAHQEERLFFLSQHRDRKELPILNRVRFTVVRLDARTALIEIEDIKVLDGR